MKGKNIPILLLKTWINSHTKNITNGMTFESQKALPHSLNAEVFNVVPVCERNWTTQVFVKHVENRFLCNTRGKRRAITTLNLITTVRFPEVQLPLIVVCVDGGIFGYIIFSSVDIQQTISWPIFLKLKVSQVLFLFFILQTSMQHCKVSGPYSCRAIILCLCVHTRLWS